MGKETIRSNHVLSIILFLGVAGVAVATPPSWPKGHDFTTIPSGAEYKPGELFVRFAPKPGGGPLTRDEMKASLQSLGGGGFKRHFKIVPGLTVVKLPPGLTVERALKIYNKRPDILYAEPNYKIHLTATEPNDIRFNELWSMHNTGQTGGTFVK